MDEIEQIKSDLVLKRLNSKEELQDWIYTYLDIKFPMGIIYPSSTHGPIEAMWRIYELIKTGKSKEVPQATMLSSRDSYKTLAASALIVLLMAHFRLQLATAGAIKAQSDKMIQYIGQHFRKIDKYLIENGWQKLGESKARTDWLDENGGLCFARVVVATIAGMNSEHVPILMVDEVDVVQDPRALEEAKMIPCVFVNSFGERFFPLTVYLSTRKYSGGMMEKVLKETVKSGGEILRWNILDVTERISHEEAKVDEPKVLRYIARELPLRNLSESEFNELNEESRHKYEAFESYAGIAEHPMLSVMKNYLVDRPQDDVDNLYKPLIAVHNNFKQTSPDMGEAQLLCNKPSSSGLVYPRFDSDENSISIDEAWKFLTGDEVENKTLTELVSLMNNLGIEFYGAADWGHTDETSIGVFAKIVGNRSWLIDIISAPEMEIPEIVEKMKEMTEIYKVIRWYCDSAYPAYIKMLRKTNTSMGKIPAVGVKKGPESVVDGIMCVQANIVDSNNKRFFKVLKTRNNERVFDAFDTYKWKIDGQGNPIDDKPEHAKDGTADIMDMIRYYFYSVFGKGSKIIFAYSNAQARTHATTVSSKIKELSGEKTDKPRVRGKNKGILFDI